MTSDSYQQRASECLRFAERSHDDAQRSVWRELALFWLRLSEHAEHGRRQPFGMTRDPDQRAGAA